MSLRSGRRLTVPFRPSWSAGSRRGRASRLGGLAGHGLDRRYRLDGNLVTGRNLVRGTVEALAVDLMCWWTTNWRAPGAGRSETEPVNDAVKTALEVTHQVLAGHAFFAVGAVEELGELLRAGHTSPWRAAWHAYGPRTPKHGAGPRPCWPGG